MVVDYFSLSPNFCERTEDIGIGNSSSYFLREKNLSNLTFFPLQNNFLHPSVRRAVSSPSSPDGAAKSGGNSPTAGNFLSARNSRDSNGSRLSLSLFDAARKRVSVCSFFGRENSSEERVDVPDDAVSRSPSGMERETRKGRLRSGFTNVLTMNRINKGSRRNRKRKKEKSSAKKERKATQTLAIVLGE